MDKLHHSTDPNGPNQETGLGDLTPNSENFYNTISEYARKAGHAELAERLSKYAISISVDDTCSTEHDWVYWDRRDLWPEKKRHISPNSELYEIDRRRVRDELKPYSGYREFDKEIVDRIMAQPDKRDQLVAESSEDIENSRKDWLGLLNDDDIGWCVKNGIVNDLAKQGHCTLPEIIDWQDQASTAKLVNMCSMAINGLSTAEFYSFIEHHIKTFGVEAQKMTERFVEYERQFRQKLNEYISNRIIPISRDEAILRLEQFRVSPLDQITRKASTAAGEFDIYTTDTYVADGQTPEDERNTYFHERLHAIGGRTVLYDPEQYHFGESIEFHKTGMRIGRPTSERFLWLDEAITTELADIMSGYGPNNDIYTDERRLMSLFLYSGKHVIPRQLLLDAYFEDYEPDSAEKIPALKKFLNVVGTAYEPKFLIKLDKTVQEQGIEAGVELVQAQHH